MNFKFPRFLQRLILMNVMHFTHELDITIIFRCQKHIIIMKGT